MVSEASGRLRKTNIGCFLSYVEFDSIKTNILNRELFGRGW
jgi:hypothetical protein